MLTRLRHSRPVGIVRYRLYRDVLLAYPRRRSCNICGWIGRRFLAYTHPGVLCPQCGSQVRHRLIAEALRSLPIGRDVPLHGGRILHVSPEYCLGLLLRPSARRYVRADLHARDCDVLQDVTCVPFCDGSFDAVIASDVLEHVEADRAALAEFHRVLRKGGSAILTVPQSDSAHETLEDPSVSTAALRAKLYGQPDHVRNYGADFADRVAAAGFRVTCVSVADFDPLLARRHVLAPPSRLPHAWGWNDRRVYFGMKP